MKLIHGAAIKNSLRKISPTKVAVAYVGIDWKDYVQPDLLEEIVLSPTLGTNPFAVMEIGARLGWKNVYFLDKLHSKFYIGETHAAVGSFNLTANGLSAEGLEEAGIVVEGEDAISELLDLHRKYKQEAEVAYPTTKEKLARLAELRSIWDRSVKTGVIRSDAVSRSFDEYCSIDHHEIYVSCVWGSLEYNEKVVFPSTIRDALSFLESDNIYSDRWVLCWHARNDGYADDRRNPYWLHIDEVVANGAIDTKYTKLVFERNDRSALSPPFELSETFVKALKKVLRSGRFPAFLGSRDPWSINDTLPLLPDFFGAIRDELRAKSDHKVLAGPVNATQSSLESLRAMFSARIREAMDISLAKGYVTHSIDGMLARSHAVEVARQLVEPGGTIKSGLKKLAKEKALKLSFESIMLENQFEPLFSKRDLELASFNLFEVDPNYQVSIN